jgi:hypothetical protein
MWCLRVYQILVAIHPFLFFFFHRYFALNSCTLCISKNGYISRNAIWKIWQASQRIFVLHSKYCAQLMFLEVW